MRVLILNHYVPPDPSPTAVLLGELATALENQGCEVELVTGSSTNYKGGGGGQSGGIRRLIGYVSAHCRIAVRSLCTKRPDLVICLTDPPCLVLTASIVARFHRARLVHWAMDIYPEIAVALGEIPEGAGKLLEPAIRLGYGSCDLVIALDGDMAAHLQSKGVRCSVLKSPPWVPKALIHEAVQASSAEKPSTRPFQWMYSGNLGRAHDWRTLIEAQALLEERGAPIELLIQGGGAGYAKAEAESTKRGLHSIHFRPYAPQAEVLASLLAADAHITSLRDSVLGLLHPSKIALNALLPRPQIWLGRDDAAPFERLRHGASECQAIPIGDAAQLACHLETLSRAPRLTSSGEAFVTVARAAEAEGIAALDDLTATIQSIGDPAN